MALSFSVETHSALPFCWLQFPLCILHCVVGADELEGADEGGEGVVVSSMVILAKLFLSEETPLAEKTSRKSLLPSATSLLGTSIGMPILSCPARKVKENFPSPLEVIKSSPNEENHYTKCSCNAYILYTILY